MHTKYAGVAGSEESSDSEYEEVFRVYVDAYGVDTLAATVNMNRI